MLRAVLVALAIVICTTASAQEVRIKANKENPHWVQYLKQTQFVVGYPRAVSRGAASTKSFNYIEDIRLSSERNNKLQTLTLFDVAGKYLPWQQNAETGKFDLDTWNDFYWGRIRDYAATCCDRMNTTMLDVTLWDEQNLRGDRPGAWPVHPMNPKNNTNYGEDQLPTDSGIPAFYRTVPALDNKPTALKYQEALMAKAVYSMTLYQNAIFSLGGPSAPKEWTDYWVDFIHKEAEKMKIDIIVSADLGTTDKSQPDAIDVSAALAGKTLMEQQKIISDAYNGVGSAGGKEKIIWASHVPAENVAQLWIMFASGGGGMVFDQNQTKLETAVVDKWIENFRGMQADMKIAPMRPDQRIVKEGTAFALVNPGAEAIIYIPFGGDVTLDLSSLKGGCYGALWDPVAGSPVKTYDLPSGTEVKVPMPANRVTGMQENGYPKPGAQLLLRVYAQAVKP